MARVFVLVSFFQCSLMFECGSMEQYKGLQFSHAPAVLTNTRLGLKWLTEVR
jgi:hypothetical protein